MSDPPVQRDLPTWRDVAVTVVLVGVVILGTAHIDEPGARPVDALAYACGVGAAASLVLWRRWAEVVAAITGVALLVYAARDYPGGPAFMPGPLALVGLGYVASRRVAWLGAAGVIAAMTVGRRIAGGPFGADDLVVVGWAIAAVLGGMSLRARDERASVARERAAHRAQQALADERLRIAQDLHDSVAHAMATINVQAGVAAHLVDRSADQARESLEAIRVASRDALEELGVILRVLRDRNTGAPRQPLAGLDQVDALVERARADGLRVALEADGDHVGVVPHSVSATAYRVVQEALTNTRRHAGASASARVGVTARPDGSLVITVADDGNGAGPGTAGGSRHARTGNAAAPASGLGLVGMRERVESTGGSLEAGPDGTRGGYRVVATWPPRP